MILKNVSMRLNVKRKKTKKKWDRLYGRIGREVLPPVHEAIINIADATSKHYAKLGYPDIKSAYFTDKPNGHEFAFYENESYIQIAPDGKRKEIKGDVGNKFSVLDDSCLVVIECKPLDYLNIVYVYRMGVIKQNKRPINTKKKGNKK